MEIAHGKQLGTDTVFRPLATDDKGRLIVTGDPTTPASFSSIDIGAKADAVAPWYSSAASLLSLIKLGIAAAVGAGSRTWVYTNSVLTSETWTLAGTTRTKTYTYTAGVLTGESDWV